MCKDFYIKKSKSNIKCFSREQLPAVKKYNSKDKIDKNYTKKVKHKTRF